MAHGSRKTNRLRGSRTHGYGNAQKHRGAGSRGGRGMSGSKKQKWARISKNMKGYFGKKGFKRHKTTVEDVKTMNVGYLSDHIGRLVSEGAATESKGAYTIDLAASGIGKLLGAGKVESKLNITVNSCSPRAREKIEAAGGTVEVQKAEDEFLEAQSGEEAEDSESGE
ncbi:MAG: 50S ribosomal protein L15 [Candidatus Altiarchaeales archaeon]|nr:50S ribosomal protein L15 [Candidatus Altiarchaeales archaeon]MBD3415798.1 50S ribosomal protein L15 [Candidatus Altiarchaeales archaeon]